MKNQNNSLVSNSETKEAETGKIDPSKTDQFPIRGNGASAGGLEAMEQFFGHLPADCEMAFMVIQHPDINHKGIMPELLLQKA